MTNPTRQPAGIPTGGQFAATDRAESAVTLEDGVLSDLDAGVDAFLALDAHGRVAAAREAEALERADRIAAALRESADGFLGAAPAGEPVGYTYKAENFRSDRIVEKLIADGLLAPAARDIAVVDAIEQAASTNAIDMDDQYSYDSDNFPKPVYADQVDLDVDAEWLGDLETISGD